MSIPVTSVEAEQDSSIETTIAQAQALVTKYPGCFWFWSRDARVTTLDQVKRVVQHLRENGGREEWLAAQALHQCLSQHTRNPS